MNNRIFQTIAQAGLVMVVLAGAAPLSVVLAKGDSPQGGQNGGRHQNGGDALAHYNRGVSLQAEGKSHEAIAEYREAIRLQPDLVDAHYNLGLALTATGDQTGAIAAYRSAVQLKPGFAAAHHALGVALAK